MEKPKEPSTAHVQSVERALRILDLLASENREMQLTEIAHALQWPKSTVHGLLSTLREYQYIDQSSVNGRYKLGVRLFELGNIVARGWDVRTAALPVMQRLGARLGETVHLATDDKGEVLYIEKLDSTQTQGMRIVSETGARLPMHCSGIGKALLAYKTQAEIKYIINTRGLRPMTERTITQPAKLMEELAHVRELGYAIDDREIMDGLRCAAAPIYAADGRVRYALSVSGFAKNLSGNRLTIVVELVCQAAAEISHAIGYRQTSPGTGGDLI